MRNASLYDLYTLQRTSLSREITGLTDPIPVLTDRT